MCGYKKFKNPRVNCLNFVYQYKQLAIPCMYAHEPTFIDKSLEYVKCSWEQQILLHGWKHVSFGGYEVYEDELCFYKNLRGLGIHLPLPCKSYYLIHFYKTKWNNAHPIRILCKPNSHWIFTLFHTHVVQYEVHWVPSPSIYMSSSIQLLHCFKIWKIQLV